MAEIPKTIHVSVGGPRFGKTLEQELLNSALTAFSSYGRSMAEVQQAMGGELRYDQTTGQLRPAQEDIEEVLLTMNVLMKFSMGAWRRMPKA